MNTASRMESTGLPNRIQVSQETADLLESAGKGGWLTQREDKVIAKGKGHLTTYWLDLRRNVTRSVGSRSRSDTSSNADEALVLDNYIDRSLFLDHLPENIVRLVEWNSEVLFNLLQKIDVQRRRLMTIADSRETVAILEQEIKSKAGTAVIDEVVEIITLPDFVDRMEESPESNQVCKVDETVKQQLRKYLSHVAAMYRNNPFHNFEHASVSTLLCATMISCHEAHLTNYFLQNNSTWSCL